MPIFRLEGDEISNAKLVIAQETDLELESHLEDWLENSPWALAQEPILWIGRQTSASVEESIIFPDLLGLDTEGNLVIVELKKNRAPREVVAQLLEYAVWANELSEQQIHEIAETYFETRDEFKETHFHDVFRGVFDIPETDEIPPLNRNLRLFIVASDIPINVASVCRFLRTSHGMDINCINVSTFQTEAGERLVSMEATIGDEVVTASKTRRQRTPQTSRWSGDKLAREVIWEAVQAFTNGDANVQFTLKDIERVVSDKHPDFNVRIVRNWLRGGCVNFRTRHNYTIDEDRYWWVKRGWYRLYNSEKDRMECNGETN